MKFLDFFAKSSAEYPGKKMKRMQNKKNSTNSWKVEENFQQEKVSIAFSHFIHKAITKKENSNKTSEKYN